MARTPKTPSKRNIPNDSLGNTPTRMSARLALQNKSEDSPKKASRSCVNKSMSGSKAVAKSKSRISQKLSLAPSEIRSADIDETNTGMEVCPQTTEDATIMENECLTSSIKQRRCRSVSKTPKKPRLSISYSGKDTASEIDENMGEKEVNKKIIDISIVDGADNSETPIMKCNNTVTRQKKGKGNKLPASELEELKLSDESLEELTGRSRHKSKIVMKNVCRTSSADTIKLNSPVHSDIDVCPESNLNILALTGKEDELGNSESVCKLKRNFTVKSQRTSVCDTVNPIRDVEHECLASTSVSNPSTSDNVVYSLMSPSSNSLQSSIKSVSKRRSLENMDQPIESDSDAESRKAIKESAQRRIELNLSTSESDSKYRLKPNISEYTEHVSGSDSAPEALSFEAGRNMAMASLKNAVESIQREKKRRKEKRKARFDMLKQQKEEKLIRLKEKLASQEDASCSSSEESGYEEEAAAAKKHKKKASQKGKSKTEKENVDEIPKAKKTYFSGAEEEDVSCNQADFPSLKRLPSEILENLPDQITPKIPKPFLTSTDKDEKVKKRKKEVVSASDEDKVTLKKMSTSLDYIPLKASGTTKFGVVPLDKDGTGPKSLVQQAEEFRYNMLFGSRIKREPAKNSLIYKQKLAAAGKNVFAR